ncbi:MAG TPA: hypothetical protein VGP47_07950, partial [Parachlamydiaceae bacterium]|nr:hypothetical protein [Parachlamydiaceae bacterium]
MSNLINRRNALNFAPIHSFNQPLNKEIFTVGPIEIPPQITFSPTKKIIYSISSIVSLGLLPLIHYGLSRVIAMNILPAMLATQEKKNYNSAVKNSFAKQQPEIFQEFDLKLDDCAVVNGMAVFKNGAEKADFTAKNAQSQQWMINFNGNGQFYEEGLARFQEYGKNHEVNVLAFNYRGVGESQGEALNPSAWIADGEACVRYLLSKGVLEENIYIPGLSLGGAIGTQVASLHEKIELINERSFGRLSDAAAALTENFLIGTLFRALGWELDNVKAYEKITARKLIIFHPQDALMCESSLYRMVKESIKKNNPAAVEYRTCKGRLKNRLKPEFKPDRVKLQKDFGHVTSLAHNYDIQSDATYPQ